MNKYTKWAILTFIILLFHFYLATGFITLFQVVNDADWTSGELGAAVRQWKESYLNPIDVYSHLVRPENSYDEHLLVKTLLCLPITFLLFVILKFRSVWLRGTYKDASEYGSHGTARWATRREIFRKGEVTGNPYNELESAGVVLGYLKQSKNKAPYVTIPPDSELNQNVVVFGGSGIGKDYTYIKTQIFHTMVPFQPKGKRLALAEDRATPKEYSIVVTDPKGECYRDTAMTLEQQGYEVYAFNLVNMKHSHRWNALDYVDDELEAERLANLIVNSDDHKTGDPFWPRAEKALMCAIILFVKFELPEDQQHLANVVHIGMTYNEEERMNALFGALPYNHPAITKYNIFRAAPSETRAGILIGFGTQLSLFANRKIADLTSQSDFRLDNIGKKKTALFLIIPDGDTTFKDLTSLFFAQAFEQWWKVANEHGGTCPVGIRFLGNEFKNIGKIPMLAERTSVMRSKGISIQIVLQSRVQLNNLYDKEADEIFANCDTIVFLGTNDNKTALEMEKELGETTIEIQTKSQSETTTLMSMDKSNISTQHQGRKLRTANEIKKNSRKKNIIVQSGSNPFETYKTPFTHHPLAKGYKERRRDPNEVIPPKHRGIEYFTEEDFNRLIGVPPIESLEVAAAYEEPAAFPTHVFNALNLAEESSPEEFEEVPIPAEDRYEDTLKEHEDMESVIAEEEGAGDMNSLQPESQHEKDMPSEEELVIQSVQTEEGVMQVDTNTGEILDDSQNELPDVGDIPTDYTTLNSYLEAQEAAQVVEEDQGDQEDKDPMDDLEDFLNAFKSKDE